MPQRQANIRLDDRDFERLEVAAFVHRRAVADELRAAVTAWLDAMEENPLFQTAGGAREPLPEEKVPRSNVSSLDAKRGRNGS